MRTVAGLTVLFLFLLVSLSPMAALAQQVIDRPTYAPGDFWTYDVQLGEIPEINQTEGIVLDIDVTGNYTVTIEGIAEVDIGGQSTAVYNASRSLELGVVGIVDIPVEEFPLNASVSGTVTVDDRVYMAQEGLEVLMMNTSIDADITLNAVVQDVQLSLPLAGAGSAEVEFEYLTDTWSFPYELGKKGSESFQAAGRIHFEFTFFDDMTTISENISANGTFVHEAVREETVTVGAGTFSTLVVNTTTEPEDDDLPPEITVLFGSQLSYWASQVGAPVKQEILDGSGETIVELSLTSYRFQAAERLTILGLDVIYWIPIVAVIAGGVVAVVFLRARRKPPTVE